MGRSSFARVETISIHAGSTHFCTTALLGNQMIRRDGNWYLFTLRALAEEAGMSLGTVRHRLSKLTGSGIVRVSYKVKGYGENVYISGVDPVRALEEYDSPPPKVVINSGFWNNPFNINNAVDRRWENEKGFA